MYWRFIGLAVGSIVPLLIGEAHGQYSTIINSPPDIIDDDASFGSNTQVNVFDGSLVGGRLTLGDFGEEAENTQLNVLGGHVDIVDAWNGSDVNVLGGSIGVANLLGGHASMASGSVQTWALFASSQLSFSGGYAAFIETAGLTIGVSPDSSHLLITGGEVDALDATGDVVIEGGAVGDGFIFRGGGRVQIAGGAVGDFFEVGGLSSDGILDRDQGQVSILGGSVGDHMTLGEGRTLFYAGGVIGDSFEALDGSSVNILGSDFFVNGAAISNPGAGQAIVLSDRNVTLGGLLSDGKEFHFDLNDTVGRGDYFSPTAIVSITFVPEPMARVLAILLLTVAWTGGRPRR